MRLFVFDLDGTALGGGKPYARFSPAFSAFLDDICARGWAWGTNTTWDINGQWELVLNSPVHSRPRVLMGEMGHVLATVTAHGPSMVKEYSASIAEQVRKANLYARLLQLLGKIECERVFFYGHLFSLIPRHRNGYAQACAHELLADAPDLVLRCTDTHITVHPACLGKGTVLAAAEKFLGIPPRDVVVAGDEPMDIPMLTAKLGTPICPANAHESVRKQVLANGGAVGSQPFAAGVMEAFLALEAGAAAAQPGAACH